EIDCDDAARRADEPRRELAPAARARAEIHADGARLEQTLFVVDLLELERGARAEALALGLLDVDVAFLALPPALARSAAARHGSAMGGPRPPDSATGILRRRSRRYVCRPAP